MKIIRSLSAVALLTVVSHIAPVSFLRVSYVVAAAEGDAEITSTVKSQLAAETSLKGTEIAVTTEKGVVTLKGVVPSPLVRLKAVEITQSIKGVTKVKNKIEIASK